jgi:serine/threonine protein kinase
MQALKTVKGEYSTYKIEDQCLGSGHFAEVYCARDLATKQTRACKIINLVNRSFNQEERDAIDTEIDILRQVHHVSGVFLISMSFVACLGPIITILPTPSPILSHFPFQKTRLLL